MAAADRHPYRPGHGRGRGQDEVHLRHLGRCGEHRGADGIERRGGPDHALRKHLKRWRTPTSETPEAEIVWVVSPSIVPDSDAPILITDF